MKNIKVLILSLMFILLFSVTAFAEDETIDNNELTQSQETTVEPRYTYIGYIYSNLAIDENGHIVYSGAARAPYYNLRLSVYLQRSKNQFLWSEVRTHVKTGYDVVEAGDDYDLSADDYYYRTKVVVEVLDDDRNVIETQTLYSDSDRY